MNIMEKRTFIKAAAIALTIKSVVSAVLLWFQVQEYHKDVSVAAMSGYGLIVEKSFGGSDYRVYDLWTVCFSFAIAASLFLCLYITNKEI